MSLWNVLSASRFFIVVRSRHGHFQWLAFNTDERLFDFKTNFLFDFESSASRLLIISRIRHVFYGNSSLI